MGKKALAKIEEGVTASSVAYGCAALLDAGLVEQLGPGGADEDGLAGGGRLAVRVARKMQLLKHNFEISQEALARIRDELQPWRDRRDKAHHALYERAKDLRRFCRGVFPGRQGDAFLGLRGSLPREPKELYAAFGPVVRRLADPEWSLPEYIHEGISINRKTAVESALLLYRELGTSLAGVKEGEIREAVAQAAKKRAENAHNAFVGKGTRFLFAALELAGLDDLAATVRPGLGRQGRPAKKQLAEVTSRQEPALLEAVTQAVVEQLEVSETGPDDAGEGAVSAPLDDESQAR